MSEIIDLDKLLAQLNFQDKNVNLNYPHIDILEFDILPDVIEDFKTLLYMCENELSIANSYGPPQEKLDKLNALLAKYGYGDSDE